MCGLCATPVEGRTYCPRCFDLLYNRGAFTFARRQFTLPGVTLGLGLGGFISSLICFCVFIGAPMAIGGIATGVKALKEHRERPDLPNRGLTVTGLVFSGLALVVAAVQAAFWIAMVVSRGG